MFRCLGTHPTSEKHPTVTLTGPHWKQIMKINLQCKTPADWVSSDQDGTHLSPPLQTSCPRHPPPKGWSTPAVLLSPRIFSFPLPLSSQTVLVLRARTQMSLILWWKSRLVNISLSRKAPMPTFPGWKSINFLLLKHTQELNR